MTVYFINNLIITNGEQKPSTFNLQNKKSQGKSIKLAQFCRNTRDLATLGKHNLQKTLMVI